MEFVKKLSRKQLFQHSYKDPSEYFASLLVLPNKIAGVAGLDVLSPDFKRFTPNLIGLVLTYVMFAGVSFSTIVEVRDDVDDLIYCLVTLGMGMQGLMKIFTFLLARDELVWIQEYSKRLFREEGIAHKCLIMNNILLMNVVTKLILVFYAFTTVFMLVAPMFITLTTDHKLLTFGFWLPFVDRFSWLGYGCNLVMHVIMSIFISAENMGPDTIYFMTLINSYTQIDLMLAKIREVNNKIANNNASYKEKLNDVFKRHQEHLEYIGVVEDVYRGYFFVLFSSLGASLVLVLYAVVTRSWLAGYNSCVFIINELFIFCFLPTLLERKVEELEEAIYGISWYDVPISTRRSICLCLDAVQQPVSLSMIFYPLNMPTFQSLMNTIYSYLTLLLTFRDE
ncbi:odorant receptor 30a isoform X2 [Culex quinquefasciatus]|uniref:odorant receptor 30a isoform X2 n=1 Tax=Culex quinquefasciatus TaxID=7176 RepID=UPI0018E3C350|nr:odorant receptor 30a isoform X2 [Culex quinquefasciatus]